MQIYLHKKATYVRKHKWQCNILYVMHRIYGHKEFYVRVAHSRATLTPLTVHRTLLGAALPLQVVHRRIFLLLNYELLILSSFYLSITP